MTAKRLFLLAAAALAVAAAFWWNAAEAPWRQPVAGLAAYDYGLDRTPVLAVQHFANAQDAAGRIALENALIRLLDRPDLPRGARDETCRLLALIGTDRSVPALERLAADSSAGFLAIAALMDLPGPRPDEALRRALGEAPQGNREAIVGALGRRRSAAALPALVEAARGGGGLADAAFTAIGELGSPEALRALCDLVPAGDSRLVPAWAKINGASRLVTQDPAVAAPVFLGLLESPAGPGVRLAAATGLARADGAQAVERLVPVLQDPDPRVRAGVAALLPALPQSGPAIAAAWPGLDPAERLVIVRAAAGVPGSDSVLRSALSSDDPMIRCAAIDALGESGNAGAMDDLLPFLSAGSDESAAALASLSRLRAPEAAEKLRAALAQAQGPAKAALLAAAANRLDRSVLAQALKATADPDPSVRSAAFRAVGLLAGPEDLPALLAMLPDLRDPADLASWTKTLLAASKRSPDADGAAELLAAALPSAPASARPAFLLALAGLSAPRATAALSAQLHAPDAESRKAVIRILSSVRNPACQGLLLAAAREGSDPSERILALRGYLDGVKAQTDAAPETLAKAYTDAWPLADRPEEKDAILAALKALKGPAAKKAAENLSSAANAGGNP